MIIAIDGGTTNTRLTLIASGRVIGRVKRRAGARDGGNGGNAALAEAVKSGIDELLGSCGVTEGDVRLIALSGMIGSETGLACVPHIVAPAGTEELRAAVSVRRMPEISPLPFAFIPGVKTFSDPANAPLEAMDVMRGEETELAGILSRFGTGRRVTAVMPGSHLKIVDIDERGRICAFRTSLSGELSRAAAENTILRQSLGEVFPRVADGEYLRRGFDYACEHGVNEALFKVRIQANFVRAASPEQLYAFLMGAVLRDDVRSILSTGGHIVVAGSDPFRSALRELLGGAAAIDDGLAENAAAIGAELITRGLPE